MLPQLGVTARQASQPESSNQMSQILQDLVAGSGLRFADRGSQTLKGVPGDWQIYAVEHRKNGTSVATKLRCPRLHPFIP